MTAAPTARGAALACRAAGVLLRTVWHTRVLGAWRVPTTGPVILAGNHMHNVDGPLVLGSAPRPVHFLIKSEAFRGPFGPLLRHAGQLPVDRDSLADRVAVLGALKALDAGGVLGIFPEGTRGAGDFAELRAGLAYFALRTGAPVVPVAVLGSAAQRGRIVPALPPARARLDVVFGAPFTLGDGSGRRTRAALDEATGILRQHLTAHLADARRDTGRRATLDDGPPGSPGTRDPDEHDRMRHH